jgi:hypothetical protein
MRIRAARSAAAGDNKPDLLGFCGEEFLIFRKWALRFARLHAQRLI